MPDDGKPKFVYLVMYWNYSQSGPEGIYSTVEGAKAAIHRSSEGPNESGKVWTPENPVRFVQWDSSGETHWQSDGPWEIISMELDEWPLTTN